MNSELKSEIVNHLENLIEYIVAEKGALDRRGSRFDDLRDLFEWDMAAVRETIAKMENEK
jgi:hypothetical protein